MQKIEKKLKAYFEQLGTPAPDKKAKQRALQAANFAFKKENESFLNKSKGSDLVDRLMGKIKSFRQILLGGSIMITKRSLGFAFMLALVLAVGMPMIMKNGNLITPKIDETSELLVAEQAATVDETSSKIDAAVVADLEMKEFGRVEKQKRMDRKKSESLQVLPKQASPLAPPMTAMEGFAGDGAYQDLGRDKFQAYKVNRSILTVDQPLSTFSADVDTASYAFMRKSLNNGVRPQKNSIRVEELINYFDYNYPLPDQATKPFEPTVAIYPTPWNSNTKLINIGIKGYDILPENTPSSNLVFLLDVSGSMNAPDKLPLLKKAFRLLVNNNLTEKDTVSIVVYAGAAGVVLEPTQGSEKMKILSVLDNLDAGGSTDGGQGIELAYRLAEQNFHKDAVNRVILATDGDFNLGITNQEELKSYIENKRKTGVFLSILGFGQGNLNDSLMQALAQNGNGNAAYIDSLNEARKVLVDQAGATLFTIAKDVKFQIEFNPTVVHDYRLIGYETRSLNKEDFNNDQVDAGDMGSGHTVTAIYEITTVDAKEKMVDSLRYQGQEVKEPVKAGSTEYAFLKIRYKLPKEDSSNLITVPIDKDFEYENIKDLTDDMRFAAAVAAFGQLLRNDPFTANYTYEKIIELANSAKGKDEFGYRSEFVNLVRMAKSL